MLYADKGDADKGDAPLFSAGRSRLSARADVLRNGWLNASQVTP